ncbi:MAG: histidine kinase [Imperialibacter sp.]|uniref:sensor histidine kinase n=1 Tax=Imperialibacter sp. TaxID=2038411 RepID=UPI0032EC954E
MQITRKTVLRELKEIALLIVAGGLIGGYLSCQSCFSELNSLTVAIFSVNASFWLFFWKGNQYLSEIIETRISWLEAPGKRLWVGLVVMVVYTLVAASIIYYLFYVVYMGKDLATLLSSGFMYNLVFPVFCTMLIMTFLFGRQFFISWRQTAINFEKLKSEQMASQYEALKSQVNPHFLFNSLNVLTSLVHQDPDTAVKFIKKLSEVYRFVLESRKQELIDLSTELRFVKDYLFLQQIRFGDNLKYDISVPDPYMNKMVPPLSVQMLVENAIKHNEISQDHPLTIAISVDGETLRVSNTLQVKHTREPSSGTGLDNIKDRYEFLSGKKVIVTQENGKFEVTLPLLTLDKV